MTTLSEDQIKKLQGKLNPEHVAKRDTGFGKNKKQLSYIEGWHAIAEANEIFGFDGWDSETVNMLETNRDLMEIKNDYGVKMQWRVSYIAKVKITMGRCIREGTGYGSGFGPENDIGQAIEGAIKEAETDARKRALMTFGNKFGLALYDKTQANVGYDEGETPSEAYEPKKGGVGGYKDAKGFTDGKMNSAGKRRVIDDLVNDLLDVKNNPQLNDLWHAWAKTINLWTDSEDEIEVSWKSLAMDMFAAKRKELNTAQADQNILGGM